MALADHLQRYQMPQLCLFNTYSHYCQSGMSSFPLLAAAMLVDHPTQLICIWIFICQHTKIEDMAGESATA